MFLEARERVRDRHLRFPEVRFPKSPLADQRLFIDKEHPGLKLLHALPNRKRGRHIVERKICIERLLVNLLFGQGVRKKRLRLGTKNERPVPRTEIKWLFSHEIPRKDELLLCEIVECDREHPLQLRKAFFSFTLVQGDDHFGVGSAYKTMPVIYEDFF